MKNITIGVIGAGLIGRKHLAKLAGRSDYQLVGIADVNADRVAAEHPATRVFADYRRLLDEARPEAVIIASPNQLHAEQGIECARRGIHILIEKPVTDTLETASSLMTEVQSGGIKSLVGHHRRHHQQVRKLKAVLGEGRIGGVVGVSAIWATHKPADYFNIAPWRSQAGGGPILINLIHEIDFLRFTVGEIVAVEALASNRQRGFAVEDTAAALIEFDNGALGTFFISDSAVSPWTSEQGLGESPEFPFSGESSYRFLGRRGSIEFPALVAWSQTGDAQDWNKPIQSQRIHATPVDVYVAQLDHFRDVIRGTASSLQPVDDGVRSLIATLAVAEAATAGRRIDLRDRYAALAAEPTSTPRQRAS
jgi:predicted dehydrogenase